MSDGTSQPWPRWRRTSPGRRHAVADSRIGVGMPATLWLNQFGSYVWDAFGEVPYLVGSAIKGEKPPRDVDVRVLLHDGDYRRDYGDPDQSHLNAKWVAMTLAFSALGHKMTGLPVDFQVQPRDWANEKFSDEPRSALGLIPARFVEQPHLAGTEVKS